MRAPLLLAILLPLSLSGIAYAADRCQQEKPDQASREAGCAEGCAADCGEAGYYLEKGFGLPKDAARAARFYERACALGEKMSCSSLGRLLEKGGDGLKRDLPRAVAVYEKECNAGDPNACVSLAHLYVDAGGVKRDPRRAAALFEIACQRGNKTACDSQQHALQIACREGDASSCKQRNP